MDEMVGYDGLDTLNRLDGLIGQDGLEELGQLDGFIKLDGLDELGWLDGLIGLDALDELDELAERKGGAQYSSSQLYLNQTWWRICRVLILHPTDDNHDDDDDDDTNHIKSMKIWLFQISFWIYKIIVLAQSCWCELCSV